MEESDTTTLETPIALPPQPKTVEVNVACPNCGRELEHNFCPACGQMKYRRINRNYIVAEIRNVLATTGGFFYTIRKLLRNPGNTAREFIDGHRISHYRPLYLAFVLSGFEALVAYKIVGVNEIIQTHYAEMHMTSEFGHDFTIFFSNYHSFLMILLLPIFALSTKLAFRKSGHNYYEHIVMNAYILSLYTLIGIIFVYPMLYVFKGQPEIFINLSYFSYLFIVPILVWFFKEFYSEKSFKSIIGRTLLILGIALTVFMILFILLIIIGIIYVAINGPETMGYFQPK